VAITHSASTGVDVGTAARGTSSTTVAYVGVAAGRIGLIFAVTKPETATWSTVSGWTNIADFTGGTGSSGVDTGPTRMGVWYRLLDGSETGNVTVATTGGGSTSAIMSVYAQSAGGWDTPVVVTGTDTTHGSSPVAASVGTWPSSVETGDWIAFGYAADTDVTTSFTAATLAMTGYTFGARTQRSRRLNSDGNDTGVSSWDAEVTAGSGGTTAPSLTLSQAATSCGEFTFVRLRESSGGTDVADDIRDGRVEINSIPVTSVVNSASDVRAAISAWRGISATSAAARADSFRSAGPLPGTSGVSSVVSSGADVRSGAPLLGTTSATSSASRTASVAPVGPLPGAGSVTSVVNSGADLRSIGPIVSPARATSAASTTADARSTVVPRPGTGRAAEVANTGSNARGLGPAVASAPVDSDLNIVGPIARGFNNDSYIDLNPGGASAVDGGPISLAFMVYFYDLANGAIIHALNATNDNCYWLEVYGSTIDFGTTSTPDVCPFTPVTNTWMIIGVSKANGNAIPRWHRLLWDGTPTWEHQNGTQLVNDVRSPTSSGKLRLGRWGTGTGEQLNGRIQLGLVEDSVLSDGDFETLSTAFSAWGALDPTVLIELGQDDVATPVTDLSSTGTADQIGILNTTPEEGNPFFSMTATGVDDDAYSVGPLLGTTRVDSGAGRADGSTGVGPSIGSGSVTSSPGRADSIRSTGPFPGAGSVTAVPGTGSLARSAGPLLGSTGANSASSRADSERGSVPTIGAGSVSSIPNQDSQARSASPLLGAGRVDSALAFSVSDSVRSSGPIVGTSGVTSAPGRSDSVRGAVLSVSSVAVVGTVHLGSLARSVGPLLGSTSVSSALTFDLADSVRSAGPLPGSTSAGSTLGIGSTPRGSAPSIGSARIGSAASLASTPRGGLVLSGGRVDSVLALATDSRGGRLLLGSTSLNSLVVVATSIADNVRGSGLALPSTRINATTESALFTETRSWTTLWPGGVGYLFTPGEAPTVDVAPPLAIDVSIPGALLVELDDAGALNVDITPVTL